VPDSEATLHRRLLLGRRPARALTGTRARPPVRLVAPEPGDAEQAAATPRFAGAETIGQRPVERHDPTPSGVAGVPGWSIPHHHRPYLRVEAIGTHDEVALHRAPVGQADRHPNGILDDPDTLRPQPEDVLVEGGQQDRLEQAAVHHDQWRVEAGHNLLRQVRPEWSSSCAAEDRMGRDRARLLDGRSDLQPPQHPHRVRPQQDAGADLAQLCGLLENHNPQAGSAQGDRRAQPTDAGADDDDLPRPGQDLTFLKAASRVHSDATRRRGASDRLVRQSFRRAAWSHRTISMSSTHALSTAITRQSTTPGTSQ